MVMDTNLPAALANDLDGAFERLVLTHQDRLYTIALRLLGDARDAEEVAQDALVRAYRAMQGYDRNRIRELQLKPWLATIAINLCRNKARRKSAPLVALDRPARTDTPWSTPAEQLTSQDSGSNPHDTAARRESAATWAALVAGLPDRYRTPVVLRHVDGLSYQELSTVLGRPEGTIKAQVHRGIAMLRDAFERHQATEREEMTA
jgi:RNA polymerase sigma-70 factor, ECF subfamily